MGICQLMFSMIEIGDNVQHKGFGVVMTVLDIKGKVATCGWYERIGAELQIKNFPIKELLLF
jgi:uncharacterized protein YodC (DUF2158 family)